MLYPGVCMESEGGHYFEWVLFRMGVILVLYGTLSCLPNAFYSISSILLKLDCE